MVKYLELCVDLRKSHLAKEGLYQYKNICQQVGTPSPLLDKRKRWMLLILQSHSPAGVKYEPLVLQVNIKSLEDVVRAYLKLAEEKTETAKGESQQMVLDIEDLDNIQTPERYLFNQEIALRYGAIKTL